MSDELLPNASLPDGALLRRYQRSGDEAAFVELRRRHGRLVLATCRREIGNLGSGDAALAEDAAQEAFLLLSRKPLPEDASLAGWLHGAARGTARNLARAESRRRARERRAHAEATLEAAPPEVAWNALSPHVDAALAALRPRDREAILLRYAGERSLAEVGTALGIGENAARMSVARALERLRVHLRRAGVGVSVALLATLLGTRIADAETPLPPGTRPALGPPPRVGRWGTRPLVLTALLVAGAIGGLVGGAAILRGRAAPARIGSDPLLSPAERARLLGALPGDWRGGLEYADDGSGARTRTRAEVAILRRGTALRIVARYPGYAVEDVTEIAPASEGRFTIVTGGPQSSHGLDGMYELVRLPDGAPAFAGESLQRRGRVRLRVIPAGRSLTIAEEFERGGAFRFRNRFDLQRQGAR